MGSVPGCAGPASSLQGVFHHDLFTGRHLPQNVVQKQDEAGQHNQYARHPEENGAGGGGGGDLAGGLALAGHTGGEQDGQQGVEDVAQTFHQYFASGGGGFGVGALQDAAQRGQPEQEHEQGVHERSGWETKFRGGPPQGEQNQGDEKILVQDEGGRKPGLGVRFQPLPGARQPGFTQQAA